MRVASREATERNNFGLFPSATLLGLYEQATNGIFAVLIGVVALSSSSAASHMNIMLMVVSERTRGVACARRWAPSAPTSCRKVLTESVTVNLGVSSGCPRLLLALGIAAYPRFRHGWSPGPSWLPSSSRPQSSVLRPYPAHGRRRSTPSRHSDVNKGLIAKFPDGARDAAHQQNAVGHNVLGVVIGITASVGMTSLGAASTSRSANRTVSLAQHHRAQQVSIVSIGEGPTSTT